MISGVMRDMPIQSHLVPIDFLVTLTEVEFRQGEQQYWRANNYHTYVRLQEGTDVADLEQKLLGLVDKYYLPILLSVLISSGPFLRRLERLLLLLLWGPSVSKPLKRLV